MTTRAEWSLADDLQPAASHWFKEWEGIASGRSCEADNLVMSWHLDVTTEKYGANKTLHMGTIKLKGSMNGELLMSIE